MKNEYLQELDKEFKNRDFKSINYNMFYKYLHLVYQYMYLNNHSYMRNENYQIFEEVPHLDYVIELEPNEMPLNCILESKNKKEIIPNINQSINLRDRQSEKCYNTVFERITSSELLGFYTKVDNNIINELKENGYDNSKIVRKNPISADGLRGKKVIFICPKNITETCGNLLKLSAQELIKLIDGKQKNISEEDILREIDDNLNYFSLLKIVFFHEYGHCAFQNYSKSSKKLDEKRANYFASIALNGEYDLLIEILNNKIGKEYANPLLRSHEYTKGLSNFEKEENELYE